MNNQNQELNHQNKQSSSKSKNLNGGLWSQETPFHDWAILHINEARFLWLKNLFAPWNPFAFSLENLLLLSTKQINMTIFPTIRTRKFWKSSKSNKVQRFIKLPFMILSTKSFLAQRTLLLGKNFVQHLWVFPKFE